MALSTEEKRRLASIELPSDAVVRERLERWLAATGWTDFDVAAKITKENGEPYSRVSVNLYRLCKYPGQESPENTRAIRAALVALMDAYPTASTRRRLGETYSTESYRRVKHAFYQALNRGYAYCVDGPPGTQKTHALLALADELEVADAGKNGHGRRAVYVRCRPRMSRRDLLIEIAMASGIIVRGSIGQMIRRVRFHFVNRRVLLILDEAQHLHRDVIETVRELLDEPPYFGLLFAGSHEIRSKFLQLEMEQWRSRLRSIIELRGLNEDEIGDIATRELGRMSASKIRELVEHCKVIDYRKKDGFYFSARNLFHAIDQAKHVGEEDAK